MSKVTIDVVIHQGHMPKKGKVADMYEAFETRHGWHDANGEFHSFGPTETISVRRHQYGYSFLLNDSVPVRQDVDFNIVEAEPALTTGTLVMEWKRESKLSVKDVAERVPQRPTESAGLVKPEFDVSGNMEATWVGDEYTAIFSVASLDLLTKSQQVYTPELWACSMSAVIKLLDTGEINLPVKVMFENTTADIDPRGVMAVIEYGGSAHMVRIDAVTGDVFTTGHVLFPSETIDIVITSITRNTESGKPKPTQDLRHIVQRDFKCTVEVSGEYVGNRIVDAIMAGIFNDPFMHLGQVKELSIGYDQDEDMAVVTAMDSNRQSLSQPFVYINENGVFNKFREAHYSDPIKCNTTLTVTELIMHGHRGGRNNSFGRGRAPSTVGTVPTREWIPQLNQAVYLEDDPKQEMYYISDFDQYDKKFIITMADSLRATRKKAQAVDGIGASQVAVDPGRLRPFILFY